MTIFTIGHSTRSLEEFVRLLQNADVKHVVDVRRFPHSRRQTQFNIETFPAALIELGIGYTHMEALGGRRKARSDGKPSPHTLWREVSFRNYADYAETPAFQNAFKELLALERKRPAIMCAEALWWQCHRRIITDHLLAAGTDVQHIMADKIEPAHLTEGAMLRPDGSLFYTDAPLLAV